jgi:hypothetical protein
MIAIDITQKVRGECPERLIVPIVSPTRRLFSSVFLDELIGLERGLPFTDAWISVGNNEIDTRHDGVKTSLSSDHLHRANPITTDNSTCFSGKCNLIMFLSQLRIAIESFRFGSGSSCHNEIVKQLTTDSIDVNDRSPRNKHVLHGVLLQFIMYRNPIVSSSRYCLAGLPISVTDIDVTRITGPVI